MDEDYRDLEIKLESAYYNRNKVGTRVDKVDLVDAAKVIEEDVLSKVGTDTSTDKIVITQTISELQSLAIDKKVAYCNESAMLYRYNSNISNYIQYGSTVITSSISGGWVEHDSYNKIFVASQSISFEHTNQSSVYTLSADTEFSAAPNMPIHNGHTHAMRMYCNGHMPTFTGFEFMTNSSPLELNTIDTSEGYYHTVVFFKLANVNRFILLDKVASADVEPPVVSVSVASINDTTVSFTVNTTEPAELKWALYAGGSTSKTTSDIDAGTGAIVHGTKALLTGNNTLSISSLTELTTYDLWQYASDTIPNDSAPAKTTIETSAAGMMQLFAPVLGSVTVQGTDSLSVPISSSSIDAYAESVSVFYKRTSDQNYTKVAGISRTAVDHVLSGLSANTQYNVYLVAVGDDVIYSDSATSNIASATTQNIAPTLGVPNTLGNGLIIELPFSRAMANPAAQTGLFTVSGGKSVASVALKSGDSTKIQVTVDSAYVIADTITISISAGLMPADGGVVYAGASNISVTNSVTNNKSLLVTNSTNYVSSGVVQMPALSATEYSVSAFVKHLVRTSVADIWAITNASNANTAMLTVDSAGLVSYQQYSEGSTTIYKVHKTTTVLPLNQWTNVTVTINGSTPGIYFNGVIQPTTAQVAGTFVEWAVPTKFTIGSLKTLYFNGNINDVAVLNRKISASEALEIATLDNAVAKDLRTTSIASSIISYFRLNGDNTDAMGVNVGANVGTPVYSSDSII